MFVTILFVGLAIFLVGALYAASGAILSSMKQHTANRCLAQAEQKAREGDLSGSLVLFLKAEKSWTLDAGHRSHTATLSDLEQYGKIASGIANAVGREASTTHSDIRATLREMRELAPQRSNFGVDGNAQNSQAHLRWSASCERLKTLRERLRQTCQPRLIR